MALYEVFIQNDTTNMTRQLHATAKSHDDPVLKVKVAQWVVDHCGQEEGAYDIVRVKKLADEVL